MAVSPEFFEVHEVAIAARFFNFANVLRTSPTSALDRIWECSRAQKISADAAAKKLDKQKKWASVPSGIARPFFRFASAWNMRFQHAHPCEALSGLQQFNVETLLTPGQAFSNLALCLIVGGASQEAAWQRSPLPHTVTLHPAGSCNWPGGVIRSPFLQE
jgi:hypothetical protein